VTNILTRDSLFQLGFAAHFIEMACQIVITALFYEDLLTQPGANMPPVTESEVLTASEGMREMMDYYAHATNTSATLQRLAGLHP
jgi:hypothetical protein